MTADLPPAVRDHAAEAARQAWVTAICVKPYVPGSGHLAVVDAVTSVVAPQIARPLQARIEELEAAQSSAGQVERDRIVEAARNQRRLAWEQDCEPDVVRVWSAIAGWVRRGAVTEHDVRGAVRPEDEAAEADRLRARVEVLTAALTELVGLHNSGANGGRMVDAAWDKARAALAAGETESED
jgi:hypothetical protein